MEQGNQEPWPPFYLAGSRGWEAREQRIHQHVNRHKERGTPPPRRARSLSREEIVRVAIAVADAEGPEAISMRRIARELDAGAMSLYWHVSAKEELLDLMLDGVQGEMEMPEPSGDWRADLAAIARNQRTGLHRHRWVMDFLAGRPPMGPNSLRNAERGLAVLGGLGVDGAAAINILSTVSTYVMGAVLRELQEARSEQDWTRQRDEVGRERFDEILAEYRDWVRKSGRYPHLLQLVEAGVDPDAAETRDERFEFGLDCLLDGIAARLPDAPPGSGAASGAPPPAAPAPPSAQPPPAPPRPPT
jgi:AcrR family transcriptional regulator